MKKIKFFFCFQFLATAVWIRINRVGIQVAAQDAQIARTRIPVFIPIGLVHDIFMLPSINNVICIVYDEVQSNMKGVLLYVVQPSDAQLIRDDFRIVKQANNSQPVPPSTVPPSSYSVPSDNRLSNTTEIIPIDNNRLYTPPSTLRKSPMINDNYRNQQNIRQSSPRRTLHTRDNESHYTYDIPPTGYSSSRNSHGDHRRHKSPRRNHGLESPTKRSNDNGIKHRKKSRTPERKSKSSNNRDTPDVTQEQQQQQQLLLQQQQQQLAAWQAAQQMPLIPMGMYNRYVPKTIPLPTGETLKTTLPPPGIAGPATNGSAVAYIEPANPTNNQRTSRSPTPNSQSTQHHRHHRRRHHTNESSYNNSSHSSRSRHKNPSSTVETDDETKQYIKLLIDEMQAMKMEMTKLQQTPVNSTRARSDSLQVDLKEIRQHIDLIRARMAMTPKKAIDK